MSKNVIPKVETFLSKKELTEKAKIECLTILRWAKSCETQEQFDNVERFMQNHQWLSSIVSKANVDYYIGACHGGVIMLKKTRFNLDNSN